MIGIPSAMTQDAPVTALWNSWYGAAFLQDDYRLNRRMTLNLGLRWDVQTPGIDPQDRFSTYVPGQKSHRQAGRAGRAAVLRRSRRRARRHPDGVEPRVAARRLRLGSVRRREDVDPRRRRPLLRQHLRQRVEHDDELPAVVHAADLHQHQPDDERGRRAATARRSAIRTTTTSAARRSPTTARMPTAAASSASSQDFEWAHAYQTNVGVQRADRQVAGASARPTSGRSAATCRSAAT